MGDQPAAMRPQGGQASELRRKVVVVCREGNGEAGEKAGLVRVKGGPKHRCPTEGSRKAGRLTYDLWLGSVGSAAMRPTKGRRRVPHVQSR